MSDSSEPSSAETQAPPQQHLSALDAISTMLTRSSFDVVALLDEVVRITAETMNVFGCAVRLLNEETMQMELKAVYGLSDRFLSKGPIIARKSVYQEMIEKRTESGETVEIYDVREDPRVQYAQAATEEGIHSVLATPLLHDEEVIGALTVFTDRPHRFQEQEIRTFQAIANQAAAAIHLARLHQSELELRRIEEELRIASNIQAQLMPTSNPNLEGIEIAGWNRPCFDVGGDFYDFIELPHENLGIAVGDVSVVDPTALVAMAGVGALLLAGPVYRTFAGGETASTA
jgi:signal transduction protein with GAF and PtsI domain